MAFAFQKKGRGKRWYVSYVGPTGRRVQTVSPKLNKGESEDWARDLERVAAQQRVEGPKPLAPAGVESDETIAELLRWWLERYARVSASYESAVSVVRKHLLESDLASIRVRDLTAAEVTRFLRSKRKELSSRGTPLSLQTITHVRSCLLSAFTRAIEEGRFRGENPVLRSKARDRREKRTRPITDFLRVHEVEPLLAALDPRWRPLFAVCIFLGLRKGEALALSKRDIDGGRRVLLLRRSWDRESTKSGTHAEIPIPEAALPWLEQAAEASPSDLLFPHQCGRSCKRPCPRVGGRMRKDVRLEQVLRRALGRAGICEGYEQRCRARGCTHRERTASAAQRFCPRHQVLLWPVPRVRKLRFHDLRRTCASLLQMAGAPPLAASRLLRHADVQITDRIYTELEPSWLREQVNRMPVQLDHLLQASGSDVDRMWTGSASNDEAPNPLEKIEADSGASLRAIQDSNLWPLAPEANALSS